MTAEQDIETYARGRMARGELLTWQLDPSHHHVALFIPLDVESGTFPDQIAGVPTEIHRLPRPLLPRRT
jgi:hypothetical protein